MSILAPTISIVEVRESLEASYRDSGYTIGREGAHATIDDAYPHHSHAARAAGRLAFTTGNYEGRKEYARQVGYEVGLAGQHCDRPETVPRHFDREFTEGWQKGADEWADREAILREAEAQEWAIWYEREWAERDAEARFEQAEIAEARGYYGGSDKGGHDRCA